MLPLIPLGVNLLEGLIASKAALTAEKFLSKFLTSTKNTLPKSRVPVKKKDTSPSSPSKEERISDAVDLATSLALLRKESSTAVSTVSKQASKSLALRRTELQKANKVYDTEFVESSPLLRLQRDKLKASQDLVEIAASSALAKSVGVATLESSLTSISSGLVAINRTLMEFATNLDVSAGLVAMREELAFTPRVIDDINGLRVHDEMSPYELELAQKAASAKELADTNGLGKMDVLDLDDIFEDDDGDNFEAMKFLKWISLVDMIQASVPDEGGNYPDFDWSKMYE